MTNQEWLYRGFHIEREIKELKEALTKAKTEAVYISPSLSLSGTAGSRENRTEKKQMTALRYQEMLADKIAVKEQIQTDVAEAIESVNNRTYRTLLIRRYINFKPVEVIAWEQHYSERWVQTLLRRAESKIKQK